MEFKNIIVKKGQSLTDISIQEYGNIEGLFAIMVDNYLKLNSANDVLPSGTSLQIRKQNPFVETNSSFFQKAITNSNPQNKLSGLYVANGYVISEYIKEDSVAFGQIKKGISDYQLELIN